ncbi:MAG: TauD/TfdA family dioxygenase [Actinomycetota bacterium]
MTALRTFAEQSVHYFIRPHERVPDQPIEDPAAWRGSELAADESTWSWTLTDADADELERAATAAMRSGMAMEDLTVEGFPIPALAERLGHWRAQLGAGLGVVRLRGLPVERWEDELSGWVFWGLGRHLGVPGAQNPQGELLGHVKDYGEDAGDYTGRRYRTAANLQIHCDAADVVGLLCLRTATRGGESRIASSVTIFNELLHRRPDLVPRLFEPFAIDRRDEEGPGEAPTFLLPPATFDGRLRTFWHSGYMRSATRHDIVDDFTPQEAALLDTYEAIAAEPDIRLDMWLEPGDIQLISNHNVVHARTAYDDDPASPRHLLRLWLSLT